MSTPATPATATPWPRCGLAQPEHARPQPPAGAETFRRHVWVNPYQHEDLARLAEAIGADRIMFGSDFHYTDGLVEPVRYVDALKGFSAREVRQVMRDKARQLVRPGS